MGALYSGSECVVEKVRGLTALSWRSAYTHTCAHASCVPAPQLRAQHDTYNSGAAGCFTGGILARNAGWQGALGGCATFAAFSMLMDKLLDH